MVFIMLHVLWFALWIVLNLPGAPWGRFDPFPFGLLTMIVSLEAIFLSTFVLVTQNRQAAAADRRRPPAAAPSVPGATTRLEAETEGRER